MPWRLRIEDEAAAKQRIRAKKCVLLGDATLGVCVVLRYCGYATVDGAPSQDAMLPAPGGIVQCRVYDSTPIPVLNRICYNAWDQPFLHQKGVDTATHCQFTELFSRVH